MQVFGATKLLARISGDSCYYETLSPIDSCYYYFGHNCGELIVRERTDSQTLVLISGSNLSCLPPHLVKDYSHWLDVERNIILLKDSFFRGKKNCTDGLQGYFSKAYYFALEAYDDNGSSYRCLKFSPHPLTSLSDVLTTLSQKPLLQLLPKENLEHLTNILSKFERSEETLFYAESCSPCRFTKIHFVRLNLTFIWEEKSNKLYSEDFREFYLSENQQFDNLLLGYTTILILENDAGNIKVVARSNIEKYVQWNVDSFGQLTASSVFSRLSLALAHASSSTMIPEPRSGLTGLERCMELLRQCIISEPLSSGCLELLDKIKLKSRELEASVHGAYAVQLLVLSVKKFSSYLIFLYPLAQRTDTALSQSLTKKYWESKKVVRSRCLLTNEEENFLFNKALGEWEFKAERPALVSFGSYSLRSVARFAPVSGPSSLFSDSHYYKEKVTPCCAFSLLDSKDRIESCFFELYEDARLSLVQEKRSRKIELLVHWLVLEVFLRKLLSQDELKILGQNNDYTTELIPYVATLESMLLSRASWPDGGKFSRATSLSHCDRRTFQKSFFINSYPCSSGLDSVREVHNQEIKKRWKDVARETLTSNFEPKFSKLYQDFDRSEDLSILRSHLRLPELVEEFLYLSLNMGLHLFLSSISANVYSAVKILKLKEFPSDFQTFSPFTAEIEYNLVRNTCSVTPDLLHSIRYLTPVVDLSFVREFLVRSRLTKECLSECQHIEPRSKLRNATSEESGVFDFAKAESDTNITLSVKQESSPQMKNVSIMHSNESFDREIDATFLLDKRKFHTPFGKELIDNLDQSFREWKNVSQNLSIEAFSIDRSHVVLFCTELRKQLKKSWNSIATTVRKVPDSLVGDLVLLGLDTHVISNPTKDLILRAYLSVDRVQNLNGFIDKDSYQSLHEAIHVWLLLRVFYDKACRLQRLDCEALLAESKNCRDVTSLGDEHPSLLIFEVEQELTIRPIQRKMINETTKESGKLTGMMMGDGKVIIIIVVVVIISSGGGIVVVDVILLIFAVVVAIVSFNKPGKKTRTHRRKSPLEESVLASKPGQTSNRAHCRRLLSL